MSRSRDAAQRWRDECSNRELNQIVTSQDRDVFEIQPDWRKDARAIPDVSSQAFLAFTLSRTLILTKIATQGWSQGASEAELRCR